MDSGIAWSAAVAVPVGSAGAQTFEPVFQCWTAAGISAGTPLVPGSDSSQLYLSLFGTGMRGFKQQASAAIGGVSVGVAGPVAQSQYVRQDRENLGPLPHSLAGRGGIAIVLTVDGKNRQSDNCGLLT